MKRLFLTLLFCFSLTAAYAVVGVGVKYGKSSFDAGVTYSSVDCQSAIDKFYGFELLLEKDAEIDSLGVNIGLNMYEGGYGKFINIYHHYDKEDASVLSVPVSIYYKYKVSPLLQVYGGFGATPAYYSMNHISKIKVFPHILFGAEVRLLKYFALCAEANYNFNAKAQDQYEYIDLSGLSANLGARLYF